VGRLVEVPVGDTTLTGRVAAADDAGITLELDGERRELDWASLGRGKVQVEFSRADSKED